MEIQWQIQHRDPHMNFGDMIQIEAPDFDPDIDDVSPTTTDQESNNPETQGSTTPTLKSAEKVIECTTPAPTYQDIDTQEINWPDAIPVQIPSQSDQQNDQSITIQLTWHRVSRNTTAGRKFRRGTIPGFRDILNPSQYI